MTVPPDRGIGKFDIVVIKEAKVTKPEWGVKRNCNSCGAKFYDLCRDPIICPKCDAAVDPAATSRSQRSKSPPPAAVKEAPSPAAAKNDDDDDADDVIAVDDDVLDDVDDDDDDDAAIEDASELGEDKDDMFGVIDKVSDEGEETR